MAEGTVDGAGFDRGVKKNGRGHSCGSGSRPLGDAGVRRGRSDLAL